MKLAKGSRRLAGRNGRLKVLAVASTGASGTDRAELAAPDARAEHRDAREVGPARTRRPRPLGGGAEGHPAGRAAMGVP